MRLPRKGRARPGLLAGILAVLILGCAAPHPTRTRGPADVREFVEQGIASWYGRPFHGRRTASGERYDMHALTAAHPTLPFGTIVKVTNRDNGRSVNVRINDRGPFKKNRIIDVSKAAAELLGMIGPGTAPVRVEVLSR